MCEDGEGQGGWAMERGQEVMSDGSDGVECGWWVATSTGLVCQSWDFRSSSGWDEKTLEGLLQMTGMTYLTFYGGYYGCSMEDGQGL